MREQARKNPGRNPHPSELVAKVVADYAAGSGAPEIAAKYNIDHSIITGWVRKAGGRVRAISEANRRYTLNQRAFATLTEESAYWLGFLLADGSVSAARPTLTLALARKDVGHVESFQRFIGTNRPIGLSQRRAVLSVDSAPLVADLVRYGITPRKTFTASVVPELAANTHFMRGMLDGDGCLSWNKPRPPKNYLPQPVVGLVGTQAVCEAFAAFIRSRFPDVAANVRPHKRIWCVGITGRTAGVLAAELYATGVSLPRKKVIAEAFAAHLKDNPPREIFDWDSLTRESILSAFERLKDWEAVAAELGLTRVALMNVRSARFGITSRGPDATVRKASGPIQVHAATIDGRTQSVSEWCRELNVPYFRVVARIKRGATPEDALQQSHKRPVYTEQQLTQLLVTHGTWRAVATALGVHEESMRRIKTRAGMPPIKPGRPAARS